MGDEKMKSFVPLIPLVVPAKPNRRPKDQHTVTIIGNDKLDIVMGKTSLRKRKRCGRKGCLDIGRGG
jgi:hypothetical protein